MCNPRQPFSGLDIGADIPIPVGYTLGNEGVLVGNGIVVHQRIDDTGKYCHRALVEERNTDSVVDGKGRDEMDAPYDEVVVDWCACDILSEVIQSSGGESISLASKRTEDLRPVPPFSL